MGWGDESMIKTGLGHMTKMAAMPIYGKNLKKSSLRNQKADDLESWYAALGTQVLPNIFKWWPWDDLDLFYGKVKFGPLCFCIEKKVKQWNFSETIVVYDIKVGRCSQLNEYLKLYEYQRSRSFNDLSPNHSDSIFLNFFSSITNWPIEAKFYVESQWDEGTKVCSNCLGHMTKMATMLISG